MNLKYFLIYCLVYCNFGIYSHRQKRHLRFPKGAQFMVTVAMTTFLPKDLPQGFGHFIEFEYGYPFPEKVALDRPKPTTTPVPVIYWDPHMEHFIIRKKNKRMKRSKKEIERKGMIKKLRKMIESFGYDGPNCILRFQCEIERLSRNRTILEDIILVLFKALTPHAPQICENASKTCPISILQLLLHSEQIMDTDLEAQLFL